jgi:predicted membrane protein
MRRQTADLVLRSVAIVLMLAGVVMIFTGSSSALAIGIITVGVALVTVIEADKRRHGHAHP